MFLLGIKTDEFRNISKHFPVKIKALLIDYQALMNSIDTIENNLLLRLLITKFSVSWLL